MQTLSNERLGNFTASRISDLFVGGKGVTRDKYIFEKAEEAVKGHGKSFSNRYTDHGNMNEFEAIQSFSELTGLNIEQLGQEYFAINENCGATPDAKVVDFKDVIIASVDAKCPPETFYTQKIMLIKESKPEYQNSPKSMFYQAQMQMMALTEHNRKLGHPPVTEHYLVRYLTSMDIDYDGNKIEYNLPLESRLFYKIIKQDVEVQNKILELVEIAAKERDVLINIFKKPIL